MNRRHTLALLCLLAAPLPLAAQADADRMRAAAELVDAMDMERSMRRAAELTMDQQIQANPMLEPVRDVMMEYIDIALEWEALRPELIEVYASLFGAADMRALRDFYVTPAGRRLLELTPELTAGITLITQQRMNAVLPEMQAAIQRKLMMEASQSPKS